MFKTILVATDGSRHAERAVETASRLARSSKARLVVVHALYARLPEDILHMAEVEHLVPPGVRISAFWPAVRARWRRLAPVPWPWLRAAQVASC